MDAQTGKVGVVGAGLIGGSWAAFFASKGFDVGLYDVTESCREAGHAQALGCLASLRSLNLLSDTEHARASARIAVTGDLAEAVAGASLVQESVPERYAVKQEVFRQIERAAAPETILASSSSGLLISELQSVMEHPGRSLIAHPFNPPHLIPLVELVPGRQTEPALLEETKAWFEALGKVPVVLRKEVPGHIANRLQAAVWREAIQLALDGVASVADIDRAMAAGPGLRWALLGPHMVFHLGGGPGGIRHFIDHVGTSFDRLWKDMASWTELPPQTADALASGVEAEAGARSQSELARWRDEKLVALLRAIDGER